ncbi:MAG TPA: hypothetical protein VM686_16945 [Polyangiaceae bacterium]|nr:hypothetical protein [Polyangiaceae bacterium]
MRHAFFATLVLVAVGCGGAQPAADSPAPAEPAAAPATEAPAAEAPAAEAPAAEAPAAEAAPSLAPTKPWADLNRDERIGHMKNVVVPHMKELFQASPEPEHFKEFGCSTCHGKGAKEGKFTMPNAELPVLDFKKMNKDAPMTKWMMETVVPEMAKTLGTTPFDPATKSGLGCMACHQIKK